MKILLILPRYELALEEKDFNFGFGYLCSVLITSGYDVEVLNTEPLFIDRAGIERKIKEAECDIIGLGGIQRKSGELFFMMEKTSSEPNPGNPYGILMRFPIQHGMIFMLNQS